MNSRSDLDDFPSVFDVTLLLVSLWELSRHERWSMVELRRRVGRTAQQLDVLVLRASERGLVHETDDTLALTERGEGTARSVYAEVRRARAAAIPKFSPYTEYVPRRWWPDKSSNP